MENLATTTPEAQLNPDYEAARQAVADFAPSFTSIAIRAERCRVNTRDGRKIFDGDVRAEYEEAEIIMNSLLKVLFDEL